MSKLSEEEIEQIARIIAAANKKEVEKQASPGRWARAAKFLLEHWPLTLAAVGALIFLGAIIYEGASPLYYFKKIAAEDGKLSAELATQAYRDDLTQLHLKLGYMLLDQGLQDDALVEFKAATSISENSIPAALAIRTAELFKQDAFEEYNPSIFKTRVVSLFGKKTKGSRLPREETITDPHVLTYLGDFYRSLGDPEAATNAYRSALRARSTLANAKIGLGHIAYDAGDYQGAIKHYRCAQELYPENPEYLLNLASALRLAAKHDEAVKYFIKVSRLDPDLLVTAAELSITLRAQGEFVKSFKILSQIRRNLGSKANMNRLFKKGGKNDTNWLIVIGHKRESLSERDEKLAFIDISAGLSAALVGRRNDAETLVEAWTTKSLDYQRVHSLMRSEIAFLQSKHPEASATLDDFGKLVDAAWQN